MADGSQQLSMLASKSPVNNTPNQIAVEAQSVLTTCNIDRVPHYKDLSTVIYIWGDNPVERHLCSNGVVREAWKPSIYRQLAGVRISSVSCASSYMMLLSSSHQLYALGHGSFGQLGLGKHVRFVDEPTMIEGMQTVNEVACGAYHCVALGDNGKLYSWGRSDLAGQPEGLTTCRPQEVVIGDGSIRCRCIDVSDTMTVCAGDSGSSLYHWGTTFSGDKVDKPQLHFYFDNERIRQIAVGKCFGLALSESGIVFGWGDSTYGETMGWGNQSTSSFSMLPRRIVDKNVHNIVRIAAGERHALMVDNTGRVLSVGENLYGQCGVSPEHHCGPSQVNFPDSSFMSDKIICGRRHSACINRGNQLYTWGHSSDHKLIFTTSVEMLVQQQRQPGVSVHSGLKNCCSQPQLIYALLHEKIACVGLAERYTLVVSGEGVLSSEATESSLDN